MSFFTYNMLFNYILCIGYDFKLFLLNKDTIFSKITFAIITTVLSYINPIPRQIAKVSATVATIPPMHPKRIAVT